MTVKPKIFASSSSWIEGEAERQLAQTATLPGIDQIVGMPDLTPSKGCAVGTVAYSDTMIYPHLVGNDIGCGYSLFQTDIPADTKAGKLADKLTGLDDDWDADTEAFLKNFGIETLHRAGIGSIGGGNHFAELQRIEAIMDATALATARIDPASLVLLVHSGSRSLGEAIFRDVTAKCGSKGLDARSDEGADYLFAHDDAVRWATANRALIGTRLLACLDAAGHRLLDLPHNFVGRFGHGYLHRKGASPADCGLAPLPGSRGTSSYYVLPTASQDGLLSLAHGAGRKFSRANMHGRVSETAKQMATPSPNRAVVCGDELLMREEHPSAYKAIDRVLADLVEHGLATTVARAEPLVTYKSERNKANLAQQPKRDKEETWRRERRDKNRRSS